MIVIDDKIISDDLIHKQFECNLNACKGVCCVQGDYGAPLEKEELQILEDIYETIKPFLTQKGIQAIEEQGKYIHLGDDKYATTLIEDQPCAYYFKEGGVSFCGIEKAWSKGLIYFRKPISCQLYPIRVEKTEQGMELLNYDQWDICSPACAMGKQKDIKIFEFLKAPLIRRYGIDFYEQLEATAAYLEKK